MAALMAPSSPPEDDPQEKASFHEAIQSSMKGLGPQDAGALASLNEELFSMLDVRNNLRTPPPRIDLSPFECHSLQLEEVQVLESIYGEDMVALNEKGTCFVVSIKFLAGSIKDEDVIKIWFSFPDNYPCVPPVFEIEANQSGSFNYRDADDLFDLLMAESFKRVGDMMVFDLITFAQDRMTSLVEEKKALALKRDQEDKERKDRMELDEALKKGSKAKVPPHIFQQMTGFADMGVSEGTEAAPEDEGESCFEDRLHHQPRQYIGPISNIISKIPKTMQISRIENVMRQDLAQRFHDLQMKMTDALWKKARAEPMKYDITPQIAFHGTRTRSLPSIVQHGLVVPGQNNKVQVVSGSSLGLGIYLSPDPQFSFNYSDSSRLIVCAALLGDKTGQHHYSCVISYSGYEWVFFNAAQVLPCYVIQVYHNEDAKVSVPPPLASLVGGPLKRSDSDESADKKKARLRARANKFLPYGFGPGAKTVIEDAASFDDDEEDYGDYQLLRYGSGEEVVKEEKSEFQKYRFTTANDSDASNSQR